MATKKFKLIAKSYDLVFGDTKIKGNAYNGKVPGEEIRVQVGDTVEITLENKLDEPTLLHLHGIHTVYGMDGIVIQQNPIMPNESFTYVFDATHPGTFIYHAHFSEVEQVGSGLFGSLIIEYPDEDFDIDKVILLQSFSSKQEQDDMVMEYDIHTINGKVYPETEKLIVNEGDLVRFRLINISNLNHPMHLHGHDFYQIMQDAHPITPVKMNTIDVAPGQTKDIVFEADNPGAWFFHCHELHHASGGMIMEVNYEGYENNMRLDMASKMMKM